MIFRNKKYKPGKEVGNYLIQEGDNIPGCDEGILGIGGFGIVYYAVNKYNRNEVVALKTVLPKEDVKLEDYKKFQHEAVFWSNLETHTNIVQAKNFFLNENDVKKVFSERDGSAYRQALPFLVLEFIEGLTLAKLLNKEGSLNPLQTCLYGTQFCHGMLNAKERTRREKDTSQLLHRDISPDNAMISRNRNILKINDFGLARFAGMRMSSLSVNAGKYMYMSPEQLNCGSRESLEKLTPASDVWAFGVTIFECLCGKRPYNPKFFPELERILKDSKERWKPSDKCNKNCDSVAFFDDFVSSCFYRQPSERPQTWEKVLEQLESIRSKLEAKKDKTGLYYCEECGFIQNNFDSEQCSLCGSKLINRKEPIISRARLAEKPDSTELSVEDARVISMPQEDLLAELNTHGVDFIVVPQGVHRFGINDVRLEKFMNALIDKRERSRIPPHELEQQREYLKKEHPIIDIPLAEFAISRDSITIGQFREFLRATGYRCALGSICPDHNLHDDLPVTNITWDDAQAYCHWTGFRLPTLYEWQFAASGGDDRLYPWGDNFDPGLINDARRRERTVLPVHALKENVSKFGLRQMGGNVWEYVDAGIFTGKNVAKASVGGSFDTDGRIYAILNKVLYHSQDPKNLKSALDVGFRVCYSRSIGYNAPVWQPVKTGEFIAGCKPQFAEDLLRQFNMPREHSLNTLLSFAYREMRTDAFEISQFPVTNEEYFKFVRASERLWPSPWRKNNPLGPFYNQERCHPVTGITFDDALAYCRWAGVRIPTELEWEKASRGTTGRHYPWGDVYDVRLCNTAENKLGRPSAPNEFSQATSPYNVLDMCGNVMEYVLKTNNPNLIEKRGGSWTSTCEIYGAAFYGITAPITISGDIHTGFRVVRG